MGDNAAVLKKTKKIICIYTLVLMAATLLTFGAWKVAVNDTSFALTRALSVLLVACPIAFALSAPIAIRFGKKAALKNGLEFDCVENMIDVGKTQIVAMNKIGTITKGKYVTTDVFSADHITKSGYNAGVFAGDDELLETAQILAVNIDHPMAKAIYKHTSELYVEAEEQLDDCEVHAGGGLEGTIGGTTVRGGSLRFIEENAIVPPEIRERALVFSGQGKTPIYFSKGKRLLGIIAVADSLIDNTARYIADLKSMGIKVIMLTGDNEYTGKAIAEKIGIEDVIAEVLPEDRDEILRKLSGRGKVTLIGEKCGCKEVLVMKKSLQDVEASIRLSRSINSIIKWNLIISLIYAVSGAIIALGALFKAAGLLVDPVAGLLTSLIVGGLVILNSMRLQFMELKDSNQ
ncbi:MAG: HAD-IC family P-type ATPase [Butyrivibrio sp.]|nr:HAD-IC family P-type ATPase [Butyrivibrio sp.]